MSDLPISNLAAPLNAVSGARTATATNAGAKVLPVFPRPQSRPLRRLLAAATAGIVALSMIAASALPARAELRNDDLAKALIAALAIGALVHAIDKNKHRPQPVPTPAPPPAPVHGTWRPWIPLNCAIEINGNRRTAVVFPERCLRREGVSVSLPRQCAYDARIFGRVDRVYGEDCLRKAGFVISRTPPGWGYGRPRPYDGYDRDGWHYRH